MTRAEVAERREFNRAIVRAAQNREAYVTALIRRAASLGRELTWHVVEVES